MNVLSLKHIRVNSFKRAITRFAWFSVILSMILTVRVSTYAQSPPSRPILFVHGFCDNAFGWASLFAANSAFWQNLPAGLYTNQTVYIVEYDSASGALGFWAETNPGYGANSTLNPLVQIPETSIPSSARFFAINFYDPNPQVTNPTDPAVVTDVSVLNKANEISQVLAQIESITGVQQVNIIAHSLGGLDSRAYVENLASTGACYNDTDVNNSYPDYAAASCSPGSVPYRGDIANIITVDTPHAGTPLATPNSELVHLGIIGACTGYPSTNMNELLPQSLGGAGLIEGLNYDGLGVNTSIPTQNPVPIQAIQDFFTDLANTEAWNTLPGESDDIVTRDSQSITADSYTTASNLPGEDTTAPLENIAVPYLTTDTTIGNTSGCWDSALLVRVQVLHYLSCIGALTPTQTTITNQLIDDTVPWISSWTVTPTTLPLGSSVTISYSASDLSTNTLTRAELWVAPDSNGSPGTWSEYGSPDTSLSGNGPELVSFTFTPTTAGKYWIGTHLFDSAGNEALEPTTAEVTASPNQAPTAATGPATAVSVNSATLTGAVNPNGLDTKFYFLYGTNSTLSGASQTPSQDLGSGTTASVISANIAGLSTSTTYYFRVVASNSSGTTSGSVVSFTTGLFGLVNTTAATSITSSSATLNGTVNPEGSSGYAYFQFGTDSSFGAGTRVTSNATVSAGTTAQAISVSTLTSISLASGTAYYCRTVFFNQSNGETIYGPTQPFSTPATPVTTAAVTNLTSSSATLNGTVNPEGSSGYAYFQFGTDSSFGAGTRVTSNATVSAGTTAQAISVSTLTSISLASGTTYYFRTVFFNQSNGETKYSLIQNLTTPATPVTTAAVTNLTSSSATLNGTVNPEGSSGYAYFQFGTDSSFGAGTRVTSNATVSAGTTAQAISISTLTSISLASGTAYYCRTVFFNQSNGETIYGPTQPFSTPATPVTTAAVTNLTSSSATLNGTVNPEGSLGYAYFQFGTDSSFGAGTRVTSNATVSAGTTAQAISISTLTSISLASGTAYYCRTVFFNQSNGETIYGPTQPFSTPASPVTTAAVTNLTSSSATLNGTVNPEGSSGYAYFQFGTDSSFGAGTRVTSNATVSAGTTAQAISISTLTSISLASGTAYYCRTVFFNQSNGETIYGPTQPFSTPATPVTTAAVTNLTSSSATLNGTVNPEGSSGYAYFQFGTDSSFGAGTRVTSNATVSAGTTAQAISISTLTSISLASGTTYYFRTVFVNQSNGETKYGPAQSFATLATTPTLTVTPSSSSITTAQALSVTVALSGGNGNPTPTGSVVLSGGGYTSSAKTLSAGSANINIPAGQLAVGSDTLTATYTPDSGSSMTYNSATGSAPVTVVNSTLPCANPNPNPNPNPASFANPGDFNGDCKSDILWRNTSTQQVYEWFMNGTTYSSSGSPGSPTSDWVIQGAGDFNGDGKADILWRNSTTGEVYIWLMNGSTLTSSGSLGYVSSDWSIAGISDFNGDGKADILWRNSTTGQVYVWFISGTTMNGGGSVTYVSSDWNIAGIGDFNGDGDADILWRNGTTGQLYIWLMNGATLTSSGSLGSVTSDWKIAGVGDFNNDGKSDILWSNSSTGQIYIWFINGTATASTASVGSVSSGWNIEGVGDYDGSGRAGILWRNTSTEQVYIWLMNGATLTSSGTPGSPAAAWQIAP